MIWPPPFSNVELNNPPQIHGLISTPIRIGIDVHAVVPVVLFTQVAEMKPRAILQMRSGVSR